MCENAPAEPLARSLPLCVSDCVWARSEDLWRWRWLDGSGCGLPQSGHSRSVSIGSKYFEAWLAVSVVLVVAVSGRLDALRSLNSSSVSTLGDDSLPLIEVSHPICSVSCVCVFWVVACSGILILE